MKSMLQYLPLFPLTVLAATSAIADTRQPIDEAFIDSATFQSSAVAMVVDNAATYGDEASGNIGIYTRKLGDLHNLCADQRFVEAPVIYGACTAFLINDRQVITSPECVKGPAACEHKKIFFGFQRDDEDLSVVPSDRVFSCKSTSGNFVNNVGGAYTVVTLDRPVTGISPLTLDRTPVEVGDEVYMLSHSHGLALRVSHSTVWESTPTWNRFRAGLSAMRGSEGAPILSSRTGGVVGVHTSSLNNHVRENPFRGCNQLRMCEGRDCFLEILGTVQMFERHSPH